MYLYVYTYMCIYVYANTLCGCYSMFFFFVCGRVHRRPKGEKLIFPASLPPLLGASGLLVLPTAKPHDTHLPILFFVKGSKPLLSGGIIYRCFCVCLKSPSSSTQQFLSFDSLSLSLVRIPGTFVSCRIYTVDTCVCGPLSSLGESGGLFFFIYL